MTYYKVLRRNDAGDLVSCHGGTHTWVPGVTYGPVEVVPCRSGFHACRVEDLVQWLADGSILYEVTLADVVEEEEKVVGSTATLGRYLGTFEMMDFVRLAIYEAERTAHLITAPRVLEALTAVKAFVDAALRGPCDLDWHSIYCETARSERGFQDEVLAICRVSTAVRVVQMAHAAAQVIQMADATRMAKRAAKRAAEIPADLADEVLNSISRCEEAGTYLLSLLDEKAKT